MQEEIVNKVANSKLVQINLEDYYTEGTRKKIDLKNWLYQGIILREKDFRDQITQHNWEAYQDCYVAIFCSVDAIVPLWASMLLTSALAPFAKKIVFGSPAALEAQLFETAFAEIDFSAFEDKPMIIKGCSNKPVPTQAFVSFTQKAHPFVKSIMFGEACSTVPVYKKKK